MESAPAAAHGVGTAASATAMSLLDVVLGIIVPILLFFTGFALAPKGIGGYAAIGNMIWSTFGGGNQSAGNLPTLTGPQSGATTGILFSVIWGGVAFAIWHVGGNSSEKWLRYASRMLVGFFGGLFAFSLYFVFYSLTGAAASALVGGGALDTLFGQVQGLATKAAGSS